MKKLALAAIALLFSIGFANAQAPIPGTVTNIGPNDLFQDVVNGSGSAANYFATPYMISGAQGYVRTTPLTGFTLSFANGQVRYYITPAGTLATGTFNLSPNPIQGTMNCVRSSQTQTAVTITPPTGTTIDSVITAMTAATTYCYVYDAVTAKWSLF